MPPGLHNVAPTLHKTQAASFPSFGRLFRLALFGLVSPAIWHNRNEPVHLPFQDPGKESKCMRAFAKEPAPFHRPEFSAPSEGGAPSPCGLGVAHAEMCW
jgi:hypothetical protein